MGTIILWTTFPFITLEISCTNFPSTNLDSFNNSLVASAVVMFEVGICVSGSETLVKFSIILETDIALGIGVNFSFDIFSKVKVLLIPQILF